MPRTSTAPKNQRPPPSARRAHGEGDGQRRGGGQRADERPGHGRCGRERRIVGQVAGRAAHEQAVRVHAVGRAGEQRHVLVLAVDPDGRHVVGLHHAHVVHRVGAALPQHLDDEHVALLQPFEIGEQARRGQARVAREDGVRARAAHGQRRLRDVARAVREHVVGRAVVDGQREADGRDAHRAHEAGAVHVEHVVVVVGNRVAAVRHERVVHRIAAQAVVVGARLGEHLPAHVVGQRLHRLLVVTHRVIERAFVEVRSHHRIQHEGDARHEAPYHEGAAHALARPRPHEEARLARCSAKATAMSTSPAATPASGQAGGAPAKGRS